MILAVLLLGGCDEPQTKGRVEGVVLAAPTCPVQQQGQLCLPRAVEGEVQAVRDGRVEASTRTSPTGHYELALAAGEYVLIVDVGGSLPACPQLLAVVRAAATTTVDIDCDTGIR